MKRRKYLRCLVLQRAPSLPFLAILCNPPTRWKSLWLSLTQVWGRKTLPGTKSFQKTLDKVRKKNMTSPFKLFCFSSVKLMTLNKHYLGGSPWLESIYLRFSHNFLSFVKSNCLSIRGSQSFYHGPCILVSELTITVVIWPWPMHLSSASRTVMVKKNQGK